jgi:hypothetical protein
MRVIRQIQERTRLGHEPLHPTTCVPFAFATPSSGRHTWAAYVARRRSRPTVGDPIGRDPSRLRHPAGTAHPSWSATSGPRSVPRVGNRGRAVRAGWTGPAASWIAVPASPPAGRAPVTALATGSRRRCHRRLPGISKYRSEISPDVATSEVGRSPTHSGHVDVRSATAAACRAATSEGSDAVRRRPAWEP